MVNRRSSLRWQLEFTEAFDGGKAPVNLIDTGQIPVLDGLISTPAFKARIIAIKFYRNNLASLRNDYVVIWNKKIVAELRAGTRVDTITFAKLDHHHG